LRLFTSLPHKGNDVSGRATAAAPRAIAIGDGKIAIEFFTEERLATNMPCK
jgi:hypothetical protein